MKQVDPSWGQWVLDRARIVGFSRQGDLALAVGCSRESVVKWGTMSEPPRQMRRGLDESLARTLQTTRSMLFSAWKNTPPDKAERVFSGDVTSRIPDRDLMIEVAMRQRRALVRLLEAIETFEKKQAGAALSRTELNSAAVVLVYWLQMVTMFSPINFANTIHAGMPGKERPLSDFDLWRVVGRVNRIFEEPSFSSIAQEALGELPESLRTVMENMNAGLFEGFFVGVPQSRSTPTLPPSVRSAMPSSAATFALESIEKIRAQTTTIMSRSKLPKPSSNSPTSSAASPGSPASSAPAPSPAARSTPAPSPSPARSAPPSPLAPPPAAPSSSSPPAQPSSSRAPTTTLNTPRKAPSKAPPTPPKSPRPTSSLSQDSHTRKIHKPGQ